MAQWQVATLLLQQPDLADSEAGECYGCYSAGVLSCNITVATA